MRLRHPLKETMRAMNDVKLREAMLGTLEFFPMLPASVYRQSDLCLQAGLASFRQFALLLRFVAWRG